MFTLYLFGGGEPCEKTGDNRYDFLMNLPRTEVAVPNPTYKVFVIGRRVLNYCGGFGVEEEEEEHGATTDTGMIRHK